MHNRRNNNLLSAVRLLCLLCISTVTLHSQTVLRLRNGDRITGTIISENTNQVMFSTKWVKEIAIPVTEIQSREIITAIVTTNAPTVTNAPVVVQTAPVPAVVPPAKPVVKAKTPSAWHGDVQVGADVGVSEIRRELYYGRFKITYAPTVETSPTGKSRVIDRFRNTFDYNAAYGTVTSDDKTGRSETKLSANRMDGSSKTDFDLGKDRRVFVYNLIGAGYDEVRKIDRRYEIGPGVGYHLFNRSNLVLNAEVGMNYQAQYFHDGTKSERFFYRLAEDFTWKISKTLTFDEKFEFFPQVDFKEYHFRFESNLRYWILENLSFNLTVIDLYDTQSAPTVGKNDLQIRSSIGVKF